MAGLDEIKDGITNKDWMIYSSDKSGKIVLNRKENFLACMEEHFGCDQIVSPQTVRKTEEVLNDHARSWRSVLNIGEAAGTGQPRRCNRALVGNYLTIPTLQGLRKDHKGDIGGDPVKGPKLRPLAAANKAPNAALGNLLANILKAVGNSISKKIGAEIISTEELKRGIED